MNPKNFKFLCFPNIYNCLNQSTFFMFILPIRRTCLVYVCLIQSLTQYPSIYSIENSIYWKLSWKVNQTDIIHQTLTSSHLHCSLCITKLKSFCLVQRNDPKLQKNSEFHKLDSFHHFVSFSSPWVAY